MTHDPVLQHHNKNNAQINKMAMTNVEEIALPSTSTINQVITLFLNLSYKVLQQWVMPDTGITFAQAMPWQAPPLLQARHL